MEKKNFKQNSIISTDFIEKSDKSLEKFSFLILYL